MQMNKKATRLGIVAPLTGTADSASVRIPSFSDLCMGGARIELTSARLLTIHS
jgi:hypothetical protein